MAAATLLAGPAGAQYFGQPRYEREPPPPPPSPYGYQQRGGPAYRETTPGYGAPPRQYYGQDDRGAYRGNRRGAGGAYGRAPDPMYGMDFEQRQRALRNHREAQKRALKKGYVIP